ncbi:hypothetical protein GCM10023346_04890 [Arthrobacter gyeryongensis]|uniref:Uncharacterized protein n=1 Tax=Arthrobacter gyeryongensis TaxID=1650592 RepID=A0ABP9S0Y2_9MICC
MESVQVYTKAILKSWVDVPILRTYFESDLPEPEVVALLERVLATMDLPAAGAGQGGVAPYPLGPIVAIHRADSTARAGSLLEALAAGIEAQGVTGALRALPREHRIVGRPGLDMSGFAAGVRLIGETDPEAINRLIVPVELMDALIDVALEWCQLPSGTHYVSTAWSHVKCTAGQRKAVHKTGWDPYTSSSFACVNGPDEIRIVAFEAWGTVQFGRLDPDRRWEPAVADLADLLASLADQIEYGCVRRARLGNGSWQVFQDYDWPARPHLSDSQFATFFLPRQVPDAYGVQVLGPGHQLPDPLAPIWTAQQVGSASTLLQHRDLPSLFEDRLPEPDTLDEARRSLGPLLITTEQVFVARGLK